jgi:hypothetical protein
MVVEDFETNDLGRRRVEHGVHVLERPPIASIDSKFDGVPQNLVEFNRSGLEQLAVAHD